MAEENQDLQEQESGVKIEKIRDDVKITQQYIIYGSPYICSIEYEKITGLSKTPPFIEELTIEFQHTPYNPRRGTVTRNKIGEINIWPDSSVSHLEKYLYTRERLRMINKMDMDVILNELSPDVRSLLEAALK